MKACVAIATLGAAQNVADVPGASLLQLRSSEAVHGGLASDGQAGSGRKHSHCAKVHQNAQPKSGTTWLESIVNLVAHQYCSANSCTTIQDEDAKDAQIRRSVEVTGDKSDREWHTLVALNADGKSTHEKWFQGKHKLFPYEAVGHSPNYPRTQAPLGVTKTPAFKQQLFEFAAHMKKSHTCIIGLLRDPRDVVLSACHYIDGSACHPEDYLKSNLNSTLSWTELRFNVYNELRAMIPDQFFVVFYEDLKADFKGTVGRLAGQLGFPLGPAALAAIENSTSFTTMRNMEALGVMNGKSKKKGHGEKVRQGEACGFATEVGPQTAAWSVKELAKYASVELNERFTCADTPSGNTVSTGLGELLDT